MQCVSSQPAAADSSSGASSNGAGKKKQTNNLKIFYAKVLYSWTCRTAPDVHHREYLEYLSDEANKIGHEGAKNGKIAMHVLFAIALSRDRPCPLPTKDAAFKINYDACRVGELQQEDYFIPTEDQVTKSQKASERQPQKRPRDDEAPVPEASLLPHADTLATELERALDPLLSVHSLLRDANAEYTCSVFACMCPDKLELLFQSLREFIGHVHSARSSAARAPGEGLPIGPPQHQRQLRRPPPDVLARRAARHETGASVATPTATAIIPMLAQTAPQAGPLAPPAATHPSLILLPVEAPARSPAPASDRVRPSVATNGKRARDSGAPRRGEGGSEEEGARAVAGTNDVVAEAQAVAEVEAEVEAEAGALPIASIVVVPTAPASAATLSPAAPAARTPPTAPPHQVTASARVPGAGNARPAYRSLGRARMEEEEEDEE